jgi:NADH-quinone oxidoreductase subunit C
MSQQRSAHTPPPDADAIARRFAAVESAQQQPRELILRCRPDGLRELCAALRDEHGFDYLADLCGADCPELRVVIRLYCTARKDYARISVPLDRAAPVAPSLTSLWPAANWQEREAYDLFGIRFDGHPDLRRILLPLDWQGYPLLREAKVAEESPQPGTAPAPPGPSEAAA